MAEEDKPQLILLALTQIDDEFCTFKKLVARTQRGGGILHGRAARFLVINQQDRLRSFNGISPKTLAPFIKSASRI